MQLIEKALLYCCNFKRYPFLVEQLHFETHIEGFSRLKTHSYGRHIPVPLHLIIGTFSSQDGNASQNVVLYLIQPSIVSHKLPSYVLKQAKTKSPSSSNYSGTFLLFHNISIQNEPVSLRRSRSEEQDVRNSISKLWN